MPIAEEMRVHAARLVAAGDFPGALGVYDDAVKAAPHNGQLHYDRAACLIQLRRWGEAITAYDHCLVISPDAIPAHYNRAMVLVQLQRWDAALAAFDALLARAPQMTEAWNNRAGVLHALGRVEEALDSIRHVLALQPAHARAAYNAGAILLTLKRFEESRDMLARAVAQDPANPDGLGHLASAMLRACDWIGLARIMPDLLTGIRGGRLVVPALTLMALVDDPALQKMCAQGNLRRALAQSDQKSALPTPRHGHDKIRVGYLSSDFQNHPVAAQMLGVLRGHDRGGFEVTGFSTGRDDGSERRVQIAAACDHFVNLENLDIHAAAQAIRDAGIDILVDLNGQTSGWRPAILAQRPAPVIASWLGYAGTMGGDFVDYIIADAVVAPRESDFTEKVVALPQGFWPGTAPTAPPTISRAQAGLPDESFVFCCFNAQHKIRPETFDIWMRLLNAVPDSLLWLRDGTAAMNAHFRNAAKARGVDSARLYFAPRLPDFAMHLARQATADLFLDTWPYNAHATASDALGAGLPLLTLAGEGYAARVSASFLTQLGLPELIVHSTQAYEETALALARDPQQLARLRARLAAARSNAPFFDLAVHVADLEVAYRQMMKTVPSLSI